MEYRDQAGRQRRKRRRRKREEDHWASLAGPVEVRRLDDEHQGEAEDEPGPQSTSCEQIDGPEDEDQGDEPGGDTRSAAHHSEKDRQERLTSPRDVN